MTKTYIEDLNAWALDTDEAHILHRIGSDSYSTLRHTTVRPEDVELYEEIAVADIPLHTDAGYNAKVAELVHERYSIDDELALLNNIMADTPSETHRSEYAAYQAYRSECKSRAKEMLSNVNE